VSALQRSLNLVGVVLTLACIATIVAGNTELVSRFEHAGLPLSWLLGGAAIVAFLATEFCDSSSSVPDDAEYASSQLSYEWETAELQS
jgi:hypothetical protein